MRYKGGSRVVDRRTPGSPANLGGSLEEHGELCLAEEVERLRQLGLSDDEVASRLGVDVGWVETLISPEEDESGHPT
jgi:hypothetical protein